jgi:hypothetical protein
MPKFKNQIKDNEEEISSLSYFTNQNTQENSQSFSNKFSQIFPQQMIPMPILSFNQFSQFNQFNQFEQFNQMNQFNQFNQFNQYNQYNQLLHYQNNRFNYQNLNNNQFMNYNNNFRYNYSFQRGRAFRGGFHRNNRNNNYNRQNMQNKIDLSEYYKFKTSEEQKEYLGEILFKNIENSSIIEDKKVDIETIGKITGMILELPDRNKIFEIIENSFVLNKTIEEALDLLNWKS